MPQNFIENFTVLDRTSFSKYFAQKPSFIYLTNGFHNDYLSVYIANQVSKGVPYLVGQHGANYGVAKIEQNRTVEEETADVWLTWGHKNSNARRVVQGFNWKPKLKISKNSETRIVLVTRPPAFSFEHFSVLAEYDRYVASVCRLVNSLCDEARSCVTLRIHPSGPIGLEKKIWKKHLGDVNIDATRKFYFASGDLCVFTYMSTLFYELINSNNKIPTILVWRDVFNDVVEEQKEVFEKLRMAKIAFDSASAAAKHISSSLSNENSWWNTSITRKAISHFQEGLNRHCPNDELPDRLANLIKEYATIEP